MAGVYGLSGSGMDIDSLVKGLMKAQRVKYDTMQQKKTQLEWKKTDYNTMYTSINDFRSTTVFNNKLQGTLMPKQVSSSDETKATITANADAANINHSLEITNLASGVSKISSGTISVSTGAVKDALTTHLGIDSAEGKFKITLKNGTASADIEVDPSKSINEMVSSINKVNINVKASYDATLDKMFLYTTNTGASTSIEVTDYALNKGTLAGKSFVKDILKVDATVMNKGTDANIVLDGAAISQTTNTFTISGVSYNLKKPTAVGEKITVGITSDIDKTVANVKSFIEAYNAQLSKINTEIDETKYKDFLPLTDEQKSSMKEADITAWEAKAKSGMLHSDSMLKTLATTMRSDISSPISGLTGDYKSASNIGITTGAWQESGKLYLDETQLKKALQADPEAVSKIFGTSKDGNTHNQNGIAVRLYDTLKSISDKIVTEAGATASTTYDTKSNVAKQIATYTKSMAALNTRLENMQDAYYKKFNAMETALSKLTQQSSWLSQQLGSSS